MKAEQNTQSGAINYLLSVLPVPVEVIRVGNEDKQGKVGHLQSQGFNNGASDLILVFPFQYSPSVVFCEVKTQKINKTKTGFSFTETKQRDSQIKFQKKIEALGQTYWLTPTILEIGMYVEHWCESNGLKSRLTDNSRQLLHDDLLRKYNGRLPLVIKGLPSLPYPGVPKDSELQSFDY